MGLIRKQVGLDLKVKIEKWINEYLDSSFEYTIDDDCRIKAENINDSWFVIFKLVRQEVEIPDYISFVFNKQIEVALWSVDIEGLMGVLNKYSNLFHNLIRITFTHYTHWSGIGERVEILKIDGKFIEI